MSNHPSDNISLVNTRRRTTRPSFAISELIVHKPVPKEDIPEWGGNLKDRRWEPLLKQVIEVSQHGKALPVEIPLGINPESIESSVREEAKRQGYTLHKRTQKNVEGTVTLYLFAEPRAVQR